MTDLADLVEAFKREAAVLGTFDATFPLATDDQIIGALADAFAEAQLDGFFGTLVLDLDAGSTDPDLSVAGAALIAMYAGMRLTRQHILTMATRTAYKAGPVEYEVEHSSSALVEALKQLKARRDAIMANAIRAGRGAGTTFVLDGYVQRAFSHNYYGGFFSHETAGGLIGIAG